ncbi:MAG: hypothetical protein ACK4GN_05250 [Runella sp.]
MKFGTLIVIFSVVSLCYAQNPDSTQNLTTFSGSVGITNNGFSIIPTFSLNSPATIINFYFQKKRFSFDPDIRLVPNASKGGLLFWFRYRLIMRKKFNLIVGTHPAFSMIRREATDSKGNTIQITETLRFIAFKVLPSYQISPHWNVSAMYLNGNALQKHGPQRTHVLFLNSAFTNLKIGGNYRFHFTPTVFFLKLDDTSGEYFTATASISNTQSPFSFHGTINQTLRSNIPDNQFFMWNVMLAYNFRKQLKVVK